MIQHLLAEDCRIFLYNMIEKASTKHSLRREGLLDVLWVRNIQKGISREINIDKSRNKALQISPCKVLHESNDFSRRGPILS